MVSVDRRVVDVPGHLAARSTLSVMHLAARSLRETVEALCSSWRLPAVARDGDCIEVSQRLAAALPGAVVVNVGGWTSFGSQKVMAFLHQAVRLDGMIVDATATQFDQGLPMPWVATIEAYRRVLAKSTGVEEVLVTEIGKVGSIKMDSSLDLRGYYLSLAERYGLPTDIEFVVGGRRTPGHFATSYYQNDRLVKIVIPTVAATEKSMGKFVVDNDWVFAASSPEGIVAHEVGHAILRNAAGLPYEVARKIDMGPIRALVAQAGQWGRWSDTADGGPTEVACEAFAAYVTGQGGPHAELGRAMHELGLETKRVWRSITRKAKMDSSRTAAVLKPLPVGDGIWWRIHPRSRPFSRADASSQIIGDADVSDIDLPRGAWGEVYKKREGYSCFANPSHIVQYMRDTGWDSKGAKIIAFRGHRIGTGIDGEPLVMPDSDTPLMTLPYQTFCDRLEVTNDERAAWWPQWDGVHDEWNPSHKLGASQYSNGIMVCLYPADGQADWSQEEPPHLTLVYGGKVGESDVAEESLLGVARFIHENFGPLTVATNGMDRMGQGEANVVKMMPVSPLKMMRSLLEGYSRSQYTDFKPHVTIDNLGDEGGMDQCPPSITFDRVAVHYGPAVTVFPLSDGDGAVVGSRHGSQDDAGDRWGGNRLRRDDCQDRTRQGAVQDRGHRALVRSAGRVLASRLTVAAFAKSVRKQIEGLDKRQAEKVVRAISELPERIEAGHQSLDYLTGFDASRMRVGDYRVVYEVVGNEIRVLDVFNRGEQYRKRRLGKNQSRTSARSIITSMSAAAHPPLGPWWRGLTLHVAKPVAEQIVRALNDGRTQEAGRMMVEWAQGSQDGYNDGTGVGQFWSIDRQQIDAYYGQGGNIVCEDGRWYFQPGEKPRLGLMLEARDIPDERPDHNMVAGGTKVSLLSVSVWTKPRQFAANEASWVRIPLSMNVVAGKPVAEMDRSEFDSKTFLYHGTNVLDDLQTLLRDGVKMSNVPMNLGRMRFQKGEYAEFQPGAGVGMGLYASGSPYTASQFGRHLVAIEVHDGDYIIPPESDQPGMRMEWALKDDNGVLIVKDIPASRVHLVVQNGKGYVTDAWESAHKTASSTPVWVMPAGTRLLRASYYTTLRAAENGESGPGVYTTDDPDVADHYLTNTLSYQDCNLFTLETKRPLRLLDRTTSEGERVFMELRTYMLPVDEAIAKFTEAGFDGVVYPGATRTEREIVVHDPDDLRVVEMKKFQRGSKTASMKDHAYRGVAVPVSERDGVEMLEALAAGRTNVAHRLLIDAMASATKERWWAAGDSSDEAGRWWTSSNKIAWEYASGSWLDGWMVVPVVMKAEFDEGDDWEQHWSSSDDGHSFWHLTAGTPLSVTQFDAELPTRQGAQALLDGWKGIASPGNYDKPGSHWLGWADSENVTLNVPRMVTTASDRSDYGGGHSPISTEAPLHDLLEGDSFPKDVYEHLDHYAFGNGGREEIAIINRTRGKPDEMVTIYRSVPPGVTEINTGDWVSLSKGYAAQHGRGRITEEWVEGEGWVDLKRAKNWPVLSAKVPAKYIRSGGNDIIEWGYWGPSINGLAKTAAMRCTDAAFVAITGQDPPWVIPDGLAMLEALTKAGFGWYAEDVPRGITLRRLCAMPEYQTGKFYIYTAGHALALVDGVLTDTEERGPDGRRVIEVFRITKKSKTALTLYRGEGSHDRPSYYTEESGEAGGWWTTDQQSAENYAHGQKGQVYKIEVEEDEAEQHGLPSYYFITDPEVRKRRVVVGSISEEEVFVRTDRVKIVQAGALRPIKADIRYEFRETDSKVYIKATIDPAVMDEQSAHVQRTTYLPTRGDDRPIVGEMMLLPVSAPMLGIEDDRPGWMIHYVDVHVRFQHQGIAAKMYEMAADWARRKNVLLVHSDEMSPDAKAWAKTLPSPQWGIDRATRYIDQPGSHYVVPEAYTMKRWAARGGPASAPESEIVWFHGGNAAAILTSKELHGSGDLGNGGYITTDYEWAKDHGRVVLVVLDPKNPVWESEHDDSHAQNERLRAVGHDVWFPYEKGTEGGLAVILDSSCAKFYPASSVANLEWIAGNVPRSLLKEAKTFDPSIVASWRTTQPWLKTRDEFDGGDGIVVGQARGSELASYEGGRIVLKDEFFDMPSDVREAILYHEAGHAIRTDIGSFRAVGVDDPLGLIDLPGARGLGHNYDEIVADAFQALWCDPQWFDRNGADEIKRIVTGLARNAGFPLPTREAALV